MHVRIPIQTKINQTKQQKSEYTMLSHCILYCTKLYYVYSLWAKVTIKPQNNKILI